MNLPAPSPSFFQVVGKTTALMRSLKEGDLIRDVVGPLAGRRKSRMFGTVVRSVAERVWLSCTM